MTGIRNVVVFVVLGLAVATPSSGQSKKTQPLPPLDHAPTIHVYARDAFQELTFECEGDPPFDTMVCRSTSVAVVPPDYETHQKKEVELIGFLHSAEWLKARRDCPRMIRDMDRLLAQSGDGFEPRVSYARMEGENWTDIVCKCPDIPCAEREVRRVFQTHKPPCTVHTFRSLPILYRRTGPNTWVNQITGGPCPTIVTTGVLTRTGRFDWTYTQTRTGTRETDNPFCQGWEIGKAQEHSTEWSGAAAITCTAVEFR